MTQIFLSAIVLSINLSLVSSLALGRRLTPSRIFDTENFREAKELSQQFECEAAAPKKVGRRPTPSRIFETENFREAKELSQQFECEAAAPKKVAIIGGGLSGLACAKYLADSGHIPTVYEARSVLGGKVSAWQDKDGDWIETGLHIFFGAYPNMMSLFTELNIHDRLQWKEHKMTFAMQQLPGEFTTFDFPPNFPAIINMAFAILTNTKMLSLTDKVKMVPGLLPMMLQGQDFIDSTDELSVSEFMEKYGMPKTIREELFIAMGKALDFMDSDKLSMAVILTAMNRFIREADGSQTAFLDGNQPDRLCEPLRQHIEARNGRITTGSPVDSIILNEDDTINHLLMRSGEKVFADHYVSSVPVDIFKKMVPLKWSSMPYFRQLDELRGIPVINLQIWFDKKFETVVDGLCFSRSPLLSVYADMSLCCEEYSQYKKKGSSSKGTMLELVFAPATVEAGGGVNWISKSDEEIVDATLGELKRLFPDDMMKANVAKYAVVRTPRSVYAAIPGRNKYRPSQTTPIPNFTLAGDWTSQKFLGSMEGAVLAGKLAAEVVAFGRREVKVSDEFKGLKFEQKNPIGNPGRSPIAFGGGEQLGVEHP